MFPGDYVGIPYEELDCYALVVHVYANELNINLDAIARSDEASFFESTEPQMIESREGESWEKILYPKEMDVLMFNLVGHDCHLGLFVSPGLFLHSFNSHPCGVERMRRPNWINRLQGYYRHTSRP